MLHAPGNLTARIREWSHELGSQAVGFSSIDLSAEEPRLLEWLAVGCHGTINGVTH